jgi:hypothetical protein
VERVLAQPRALGSCINCTHAADGTHDTQVAYLGDDVRELAAAAVGGAVHSEEHESTHHKSHRGKGRSLAKSTKLKPRHVRHAHH